MEREGVILGGRIPEEYRMELYAQERSEHTIIRYMPGLQGLKRFLGGAEVSKALMIRRKAGLGERCAPARSILCWQRPTDGCGILTAKGAACAL